MNSPVSNEEKRNINPGLAAILSFLYSGLGQLYNGQIKKGMVIISFTSLGIMLTIAGGILVGAYLLGKLVLHLELVWGLVLLLAGILLICCVGTYSIFDAYNDAKKKLLE